VEITHLFELCRGDVGELPTVLAGNVFDKRGLADAVYTPHADRRSLVATDRVDGDSFNKGPNPSSAQLRTEESWSTGTHCAATVGHTRRKVSPPGDEATTGTLFSGLNQSQEWTISNCWDEGSRTGSDALRP